MYYILVKYIVQSRPLKQPYDKIYPLSTIPGTKPHTACPADSPTRNRFTARSGQTSSQSPLANGSRAHTEDLHVGLYVSLLANKIRELLQTEKG